MNFSRIIRYLLTVAIFTASVAVYATSDPLIDATKMLKRHYYESAANTLYKDIESIETNNQVNLTLGMIYHKNAILHKQFYLSAVDIELSYLYKLIKSYKKNRTKYAYLYYGEALLESGDYIKARKYLKHFRSRKGVTTEQKNIARILLGLTKFYLESKNKASAVWENVRVRGNEEKAELARVLFVSGIDRKKAVKIMDELLESNDKNNKEISTRILNSALTVYSTSDNYRKGLRLLKSLDTSVPAYSEHIGDQKTLRFYHIGLAKSMSNIYRQASLFYLGESFKDKKYRGIASYYLAESRLLLSENNGKLMGIEKLHTVKLPEKLLAKAAIQIQVFNYLKNRKVFTLNKLESIAVANNNNPGVISEVIKACEQIQVKCSKTISVAKEFLQNNTGKKTRPLNIAIGSYYLHEKLNDIALEYLETGRDKSMKNRIDTNDPLLLVNLAKAYMNNKSYSENLEIYFELSKEFPVVRHIQNSVQGIYSMEYKSAGDVRIF